jgi:hypothetical protein
MVLAMHLKMALVSTSRWVMVTQFITDLNNGAMSFGENIKLSGDLSPCVSA